MKLQNLFITLTVSLLFGIACSNGGGGGGSALTPLTAEQVTTVQNFNQELNNSKSIGQPAPVQKFSAALDDQPLKDAISNVCTVSFPPPVSSSDGSGSSFDLDISVSGSNCPINFNESISFRLTTSGGSNMVGNIDLGIDYKLLDNAYSANIDLTELSLKGRLDFQATASVSMGAGSFSGYGVSQSKGRVGINLSTNVSGSASTSLTITTTVSYAFASFTAQGKVVETTANGGQSVSTYYINGKEVSESEFEVTFKTFFLDDMPDLS